MTRLNLTPHPLKQQHPSQGYRRERRVLALCSMTVPRHLLHLPPNTPSSRPENPSLYLLIFSQTAHRQVKPRVGDGIQLSEYTNKQGYKYTYITADMWSGGGRGPQRGTVLLPRGNND